MIRDCPPLDTNSGYLYLLLCHHFADTCAVAEQEGRVVGFVSGYRPQNAPDSLFIWQVAVHEVARGQGAAGRMLDHLLNRESCRDVKTIDTTIAPDNRASERLFEKLAERLGADYERSVLFPSTLFPDPSHDDEVLFRIGPIDR